jgi:hypothetical protein
MRDVVNEQLRYCFKLRWKYLAVVFALLYGRNYTSKRAQFRGKYLSLDFNFI